MGGGSVMVWSCFSRDGVGPIYRVQGIIDQNMYKRIIKDIMLTHAKDKMLHDWTFQHDNDPKHTSPSHRIFSSKESLYLGMAVTVSRPEPNRTSLGTILREKLVFRNHLISMISLS